jgi:iron complex outermembrane recepter protein
MCFLGQSLLESLLVNALSSAQYIVTLHPYNNWGVFMKKSALMIAGSVMSLVLCTAAPAYAQDADATAAEEPKPIAEEEKTEAKEGEEQILVTGSRLKQNTFSSISPLQVITTEEAEDSGQFDAATLLQRSEAASGQQIDATFNGFVLDNGPGSQTLNLRGLGADRTLILINGRRMAPAGVEGAPTNPSINLIPSSLVDRYDLLLDGASSIYGSDAVAGVVNVIMRKNFDGLTLNASGNINPQGNGEDYTLSGAWGVNSDRGFFGVGVEYAYRDPVRLRDRTFFRGCDKHYEIDQNGKIRTLGVADNALVQNRTPGVSVSQNECKIGGLSGRIFIPFTTYGSVYYTPGAGNTRIPNFNENTFRNVEIDRNGDGIRDVDFQDVNTNGSNTDQIFQSGRKLLNIMAYGEYTFEGAGNITPFFEFNYSRNKSSADNTGAAQLFPYVPANNAFNPCNRTGVRGVDCGLAQVQAFGGASPPGRGFDLPVQPIVAVRGDRNNFSTVQEQYRGVLGLKGDLPFIGSTWDFEVSGVYSKAIGKSKRFGIREDKLALALGIDPTADFDDDGVFDNNGDGIADDYDNELQTGGVFGGPILAPCSSALRNPGAAMPDLLQGCVPVNLFAPSLLSSPIGDFATQAERDYLFGVREFNTTYEQLVLSGFVGGSLFALPGGDATAGVGLEYRKDTINSKPSTVASNGLFFGFFADRGAVGSKDIKEAFGEVNLPLMAGMPMVRELTLNVAARLTDEKFYGTAGTYSIKGLWRPVDPLALKFSYGTSFRAPNLRENFLAGQTGFQTLFDPCSVPDDAIASGSYVAADDDREATTLANCRREGRDPTRVGFDPVLGNTVNTSSTEIISGGSLDLDEETSRAITAGASFDQTIGDGFRVQLAATYFDIKVKGAVVEPSAQFILNDCYGRQDGQRSQFCDRITASASATDRFLVSDVSAGFINLNSESVRGVDFNVDIGKEVSMFGTNVDFGLNVRANHLIERSTIFIDDDGTRSYDDDAGEFGLPKWTGEATFTADIDKFRFTWQIDYTGPVQQQSDGIDPLSSAFGVGPAGATPGFAGDTCTGNGTARVAGDGIFCRDVGFAKKYFTHAASIRYRDDKVTIRAGITNLFNKRPPLVDSSEVFSIANTAIGNGYDYDGREFFVSVSQEF